MKDAGFTKTQRMKRISKEIAKHLSKNHKVDYETLLNWIEYEIGLSRNKAEEYVKTICKMKNWIIEYMGEIAYIKVISK